MSEELAQKIADASDLEPVDTRPMAQLVVFVLHKELFAAHIRQVVEIIKPLPLTRMPRTPEFVAGILNLRGQVFPVIDLKKRLNMPGDPSTEKTRIVKAEVDGEPVGFIVDEVREVLRVPLDQLDPPPGIMESETAVYLSGVVRHQGRMILLFNLDALFEGENVLVREGYHG
jgi:purine-binding chemotaxis protein CheW